VTPDGHELESDAANEDTLTRRQFLARAGRATAVGMAATTVAGVATTRSAAQPGPRRPKRVAVVGADHYHATSFPNYLQILKEEDLDIVGVHAPDAAVAARWAAEYGSRPFTDYRALVAATAPEFVVALGRHSAMPEEFRFLVEAGVPFLMEKPWGVDAATVNVLADLAEQRGAWAALPMPFRYSWFAETAVAMRERGELGAISHGLMRFIMPGVQRYRDLGSAWMLSKADTGGGALINLGIHGVDLCRHLTGEEPEVVSAVTSHAVHRLEIEDYANVTLRTPSGVIYVVEAGYTFPGAGSDQERKLSAERALLRATTSGGEGVEIVGPGRNETSRAPDGYVGGWPRVVRECLDRLARGEPPPATARDCARAVALIFDAYRLAGES